MFDGRGTYLWRARHVAIIGVVTSENSVEPFPLQALVPSEKLGWRPASGDGCAFLCFAGRSSIQLHWSRPRLGKGLMQEEEEEAIFLTGPQSSVDIP